MAEENSDSQEKTEEPSQRRLDKAREDGQILTSKEVFVFTNLFMGLLLLMAFTNYGGAMLFNWSQLFQLETAEHLDALMNVKMLDTLEFIVKVTLIVGLPLMVIVFMTQAAVGGLNFAPKSMNFKFDRINPLAGLKRMFSMKALVELGKSILKVVLLFAIGGAVIYHFLPGIVQLPKMSLPEMINTMNQVIPFLVGGLLVVLAIIAAVDYFWQRHTHMQKLRMSRQELKEEFKQTEGSPEVKAKIRRIQMETANRSAQQRQALDDVADATAVITNPTHFAVALKYNVGEAGAPTILAMGRGVIAKQIIERADTADVTVYRSPLLARALFYTGEIGQEISQSLYNAVAVVLAYIYRIEKGEMVQEPDVELPDDMQFNETGQLLDGAPFDESSM